MKDKSKLSFLGILLILSTSVYGCPGPTPTNTTPNPGDFPGAVGGIIGTSIPFEGNALSAEQIDKLGFGNDTTGALKNGIFKVKYAKEDKPVSKTKFDVVVTDKENKESVLLDNKETDDSGNYQMTQDELIKLRTILKNIQSISLKAEINGVESVQEKGTISVDNSGNFQYQVIVPPKPSKITVAQKTYNISRPEEIKGVVIEMSDGGLSSNAIFTSSDSTVVTVNDKGLMSPLKKGVAVISVSATANPNVKEKITVTSEVISQPSIVLIEEKDVKIKVGSTKQLTGKVKYEDGGFDDKIVWTSSDQSIASVNKVTGLVTATGSGEATITAAAEQNLSIKANVTITVEK